VTQRNETARPVVRLTLVVAATLACLGAVAVRASSAVPDVAHRVCDPNSLPTACPILTPARPTATAPVARTAGALRRYAAAGHRVYWAGPQPRTTYELSETADDDTTIRYLPAGARVGTRTAHRTVVTSPFPNAFAIVLTYAQEAGAVRVTVRHAVAFYNRRKPSTVYLAFAGSPYEIEVSDPAPGAAIRLVRSGRIRPIG
jgi:hypothetical protein